MLSVDFSPSFKIGFVADNSRLWISVQKSAETMRIITTLQNVERCTALSKVVWFLEIFLLKEQHKIFLAQSENALLGDSWSLLKLTK